MDGTPWLDDREQRAWRAYLTMTRLLTAQLDRELLRDSGLPHAYYEILACLSEAPGRSLRMSELATLTDSSRSRLSHAVSRLAEANWVRRDECETDRRGAFATLTDAGFDALDSAAPGHVASVRQHIFDRLDDDQVSQLTAICDLVVTGLREGCASAQQECPGNDGAEHTDNPEHTAPCPTGRE
jgi:DNA-binding MarR family transcriptional regulator